MHFHHGDPGLALRRAPRVIALVAAVFIALALLLGAMAHASVARDRGAAPCDGGSECDGGPSQAPTPSPSPGPTPGPTPVPLPTPTPPAPRPIPVPIVLDSGSR